MFTVSTSSTLPLWKRIAAFLSFVAVMSALVSPAFALAEEVRTGKLGGVCSVSTALGEGGSGSNGDAVPVGSHCDSCGSLAFALPPFAAPALPSKPSHSVAGVFLSFDLAALVEGLPPSRGPPSQI